ncbi:hypothetical protein ACLOJK_027088 [Asimina triloba]
MARAKRIRMIVGAGGLAFCMTVCGSCHQTIHARMTRHPTPVGSLKAAALASLAFALHGETLPRDAVVPWKATPIARATVRGQATVATRAQSKSESFTADARAQ